MEFHIHREIRERLQLDETLFSYTGNVIFANVTASRVLAQRWNEARGADADPAGAMNAGALFAMVRSPGGEGQSASRGGGEATPRGCVMGRRPEGRISYGIFYSSAL